MPDKFYRKEKICIVLNLFVSVMLILIEQVTAISDYFTFMLVYSIFSLCIYMYMIFLEIRYYEGLTIRFLFLVGALLRLSVPSIEKSVAMLTEDVSQLQFMRNDITTYVFPTLLWMNIYYMVFLYVFTYFSKGYTLERFLLPVLRKYRVNIISIVFYIIGYGYNLYSLTIPVGFLPSIIQNLLTNLVNVGLLMIVVDTAYNYSRSKYILMLFEIIGLVYYGIFYSFYKSVIVLPLLLFVMYYFMRSFQQGTKVIKVKFVLITVFISAFFIFFIYPFMSTKRVEADFQVQTNTAMASYSNEEIIEDIIKGNIQADENSSTMDRLDALSPNSFFYGDVDKHKQHHWDLVEANLKLMMPRFLYPDKENNNTGLRAYSYALTGSFNNYSFYNCFIFVGLFASAFFAGGWMFAIFMAIVNGFFLARYSDYMIKNISNILALVFFFSIATTVLISFEEVHDGGIMRDISYIINAVIVFYTNFFLKKSKA